MKKAILLISAVCVAACSLTACGNNGGDKSGGNNAYDKLNTMIEADYSTIEITVKSTFDASTALTSSYIVNYGDEITVEYRVERFAPISVDNPDGDLITVHSGTATISGGVVTGGEGIDFPVGITNRFTFKEEYFENVTLKSISFEADVKDASSFFGSQITCSDMHVEVEYFDYISSMSVNYTKNGVKVEQNYVFTP